MYLTVTLTLNIDYKSQGIQNIQVYILESNIDCMPHTPYGNNSLSINVKIVREFVYSKYQNKKISCIKHTHRFISIYNALT